MAYIGAEPLPGQNREIDDISSGFNGSATAFTLQVSSTNVSPESANNILVNLGGVMQNPGTDYTIAASTITFTTAPASGLSFWALILGAGINTATVADDTIGSSKLIDTAVTAGSYTTADITVDAQGRITAAASGTISGAEIADQAVTNAKVNNSAAIAGTKISPDFGSQNVNTTGRVLIGTTTEGHANADDFTVSSSGDTGITIRSGTSNLGNIYFSDGTSGDAEYRGIVQYEHANDKLNFGTAAGTRLSIDSSGKVGIGITSPSVLLDCQSSTGGGAQHTIRCKATDSNASTFIKSESSDNKYIGFLKYGTGHSAYGALGAGGAAVYTGSSVPITIMSDGNSGYINFATGGNTERMRIDSSGNVGIGTTSPSYLLDVHDGDISSLKVTSAGGGNAVQALRFRVNNSGNTSQFATLGTVSAETVSGWGGTLTFSTKPANSTPNNTTTERMRIDSSGRLLIGLNSTGTTSEGMVFSPGETSTFYKDSGTLLVMGGGTTQNVITFRQGNTNIGSIAKTTTNVSFNTSSDYRLKENVTAISDGITRLKQLIPKRFNWIADETNTLQDGFLAHEVSSTVPEAITGEKDAVDSDGKIDPQSIDQSKLVPLLTAALQEAIVKIETLETKVAALEAA